MKATLFEMIDIGTAYTKVLVVEMLPRLNILGSAIVPTQGMVRGEILDLTALKECVHRAINEAEKNAGFSNVRYAVMSVSGYEQVLGKQIVGITSTKSKSVSLEDMKSARADASAHHAEEGFSIVQRVRQRYSIVQNDVETFTKTPQGKLSNSLKFFLWMIQGSKSYLGEMVQIANQYNLRVTELFAASLASAEATKLGSYYDKNRLVIDIGAGTTDFAYFDDEGTLGFTGVLPVGGMNINRDITFGMHVKNENAEKLKKEHASAIPSVEDIGVEIALLPDRTFNRYTLNTIVNVRVKELFETVRDALPPRIKISNIVITGGSAKLKDIAVVAQDAFQGYGANVLISEPKLNGIDEGFKDPVYSTVIGLAALLENQYLTRHGNVEKKSLWQQIKAIFN